MVLSTSPHDDKWNSDNKSDDGEDAEDDANDCACGQVVLLIYAWIVVIVVIVVVVVVVVFGRYTGPIVPLGIRRARAALDSAALRRRASRTMNAAVLKEILVFLALNKFLLALFILHLITFPTHAFVILHFRICNG